MLTTENRLAGRNAMHGGDARPRAISAVQSGSATCPDGVTTMTFVGHKRPLGPGERTIT